MRIARLQHRRGFMKTFGGTALAAGTLGVSAMPTSATAADQTQDKIVEGTYVPVRAKAGYGEYNLWGTLREVIVGTPEGAMLPEDISSLLTSMEHVLHPPILKALKNRGEKRLVKDVMPDIYDELIAETEAMIAAYKKYGVKVHTPRVATDGEQQLNWGVGGRWQTFAAEPLWVVGRMVFENQWLNPMSRSQVMAIRDVHQPYIDSDPNILYFNAPTTGPDTHDYVYEGGDVLNLGDGNVIIATGDSSTNRRGAEWVARILRMDGYTPHIIDLPDVGIHHLFAVMCLAGPRTAIVYPESFPDGVPASMKDWDIIKVTREEALATGPCATMIDPKTIVMPKETPRLNDELAKRGITPVPVPLKAHSMFAGGCRCMTCVVRRDLS